jgi:hypothetical protein
MERHNQIHHIFIARRRNSGVLDVRSFRGEDYDTDNHLVSAEVRDRLSVSKGETQHFYMERFNIRKPNEIEGKEKYQVEI